MSLAIILLSVSVTLLAVAQVVNSHTMWVHNQRDQWRTDTARFVSRMMRYQHDFHLGGEVVAGEKPQPPVEPDVSFRAFLTSSFTRGRS